MSGSCRLPAGTVANRHTATVRLRISGRATQALLAVVHLNDTVQPIHPARLKLATPLHSHSTFHSTPLHSTDAVRLNQRYRAMSNCQSSWPTQLYKLQFRTCVCQRQSCECKRRPLIAHGQWLRLNDSRHAALNYNCCTAVHVSIKSNLKPDLQAVTVIGTVCTCKILPPGVR